MLYDTLVAKYEKLEATTKRLEMTDILAQLLKEVVPDEVEKVIYLTQGKIHPDWTGEPEIGMAEKMVVETIVNASGLSKKEVQALVAEKGDVGLAAEQAIREKRIGKLAGKVLTVGDIYTSLDQISKESGKGSSGRKMDRLVRLMVNSSPLGVKYLARIVVGSLRLGIGDMTILDSLALAYSGSAANRPILERAYNLTSDLGYVAKCLAGEGLESLKKVKVIVGKPIRMMSAQRLSTSEKVIEKLGTCSAEFKLDGERFQIHKNGEIVQIFSRRLENITRMYPDAVKLTLNHVKSDVAILEGEGIAIDPKTGEMKPFQTLMQRRRKYGIEEMMEKFPIAVHLFECIYVNGEDLTIKPYPVRREKLRNIIEETERFKLVRTLKVNTATELDDFFEEAIADGTEGLLVKSTGEESIYRAGARSWLWIKLKASYQSKMVDSVDLAIVGAFYGRGRRAGSYGALLAAVYNPDEDMYRTICKVGTGFTDANLAEIPDILKEYVYEGKHPSVNSLMEAEVWFIPGVVMEVLGDELTLSPVHTAAYDQLRENSGLAVRFPRFIRWRTDKSPEEATQVSEVVDMYNAQLKTV
jgi:DNA ligase-1